ncbi:MAG: hypothetical protein CR967_03185 [Proteobacteria bacterium]|nr:MAG: hypothetical protein CR967_03185 [Pseudomonadota bacterium]
MFRRCKKFDQDLSLWAISDAKRVENMFEHCKISKRHQSKNNKLSKKEALEKAFEKKRHEIRRIYTPAIKKDLRQMINDGISFENIDTSNIRDMSKLFHRSQIKEVK